MSDFDDVVRFLRQQKELGHSSVVLEGGLPSVPEEKAEPRWMKGAPEVPGPGIKVRAPELVVFDENELQDHTLDQLVEAISTCTKCKLCEGRTNTVPGEGPSDAKLMVVGEGPGANEDRQGRPFVGRAGKLLDDILAAIEMPRSQVYICNIVKCRPENNRNPEADEIKACIPYLVRQIELIKPSVILAVGSVAACSLLETRKSLGQLRNQVHEYRGIPLIVTYHPAALLRNPQWKKPTWDDVRIARRIVDSRN